MAEADSGRFSFTASAPPRLRRSARSASMATRRAAKRSGSSCASSITTCRGWSRKKRSGSRATRSRSLPRSRSNRRQSAGSEPASVVLPHCRGPMVATQGKAGKYSAHSGSQARFMPRRTKPPVSQCKESAALIHRPLRPASASQRLAWRSRANFLMVRVPQSCSQLDTRERHTKPPAEAGEDGSREPAASCRSSLGGPPPARSQPGPPGLPLPQEAPGFRRGLLGP